MNYILLINSIFLVLSSAAYLILFRFLDYSYQINNFWFNNLLTCILSPMYILKIIVNTDSKIKLKNTFKNGSFRYIFLASILYSIETILLYYCIISLSLFDYIIFRSSFLIWNILLFKYFLNKKITNMYIFSVFLLIISQLTILLSTKIDISIYLILFCSGLISSIYNCLMEYTIKTYDVDLFIYHSLFQFIYFSSTIIESIYYSSHIVFSIELIAIYICISLFIQYYCYIKLVILKIENISLSSNVILSGLEFIRRIIIIVFSCIFFKENYNIFSGILYFMSSIMLFIDYYRSSDKKPLLHIELQEKENP